jgi:hypothetical protein
LLVEPQRTNLATWSNDFSNAVWTKNQSTITSNYAVSPQGIQNASRWLSNSGATIHFLSQLYGFTLGVTYTISCYVKSNTSSNQDFRLGIDGGVTSSNLTATTEWQRFTFTANPTTAVGLTAFYIARPSTNAAVDLLIYGLQLELGSYATSLIPTQAATVTRNADVISKTGIADLIGQTEGVIFIDYYASAQNQDGVSYAFLFLGGNSTNNILIYNSGTALQWFIQSTSGIIVNENANQTIVAGTRYKIAVAYKAGDYALYINGVQKRTSTNASAPPMMSQFNLNGEDYGVNAAKVKNEFNAVAFWPTRLTNTQLAQLTTI